jgi:DNA repair protein RadC
MSMTAIAETEHALSDQLDNTESVYHACADMKLLDQEVLRVIILDTRYCHISTVEISEGTINESLAIPRSSGNKSLHCATRFMIFGSQCVGSTCKRFSR